MVSELKTRNGMLISEMTFLLVTVAVVAGLPVLLVWTKAQRVN